MKHDYMTTGDATKLARVSNQAILDAAKEGRLPVALRTVGGFRLYRREDVERFAASRTPKRRSEVKNRRVDGQGLRAGPNEAPENHSI